MTALRVRTDRTMQKDRSKRIGGQVNALQVGNEGGGESHSLFVRVRDEDDLWEDGRVSAPVGSLLLVHDVEGNVLGASDGAGAECC